VRRPPGVQVVGDGLVPLQPHDGLASCQALTDLKGQVVPESPLTRSGPACDGLPAPFELNGPDAGIARVAPWAELVRLETALSGRLGTDVRLCLMKRWGGW